MKKLKKSEIIYYIVVNLVIIVQYIYYAVISPADETVYPLFLLSINIIFTIPITALITWVYLLFFRYSFKRNIKSLLSILSVFIIMNIICFSSCYRGFVASDIIMKDIWSSVAICIAYFSILLLILLGLSEFIKWCSRRRKNKCKK